MLEALAALADVHRHMAGQPLGIATDPAAGPADHAEIMAGLWDAEQHHIRAIDSAVAEILGTPPGSGTSDDSLGTLLSAVCYWHTAAFRDGVVRDGPGGRHRQQLGRALAVYEKRAYEMLAASGRSNGSSMRSM